ncbi:RNA polymerase sigma-70 factor [Labilibaculum antarcticum]|uniref:RNA polymerase sigma-70 factor n=1 Tax=Labilibaculum antarcticum TaxID=1717717 RepID=A0A1Y1CI06_9BACT|nr:RNA polymerase sigma-70 factor [Labilibaculum antarcticum]BAX79987.1 RNA polymerase sigma-70 factor [Labilibaculum antarcticum]
MQNIEQSYYKRLKGGDKYVIDEIYNRFHFKIFRFSFAFLKNEEDAYDIVQEVFIKFWEKRSSLKDDTNLEAFLFTIAKNTVLSVFRKRSTEQKYLDYLQNTVNSNSSGTKEQVDYVFLKGQYDKLVPELPPKRRAIFLLSREKGLSNKEIAELKGISEKTVEDHITKSLAFLRKHILLFGIWGELFYFVFVD